MTVRRQILPTEVAQSFHQGEFNELRSTLDVLRAEALAGKLRRREQAILLELAEYGLFYSSFYDTILRRFHNVAIAGTPSENRTPTT